jgi:hypothetical protein
MKRSRSVETYFGNVDTRPPPYFVLRSCAQSLCGESATFETIDCLQVGLPTVAVGIVRWHDAHCDIEIRQEVSLQQRGPFTSENPCPYDDSHLKALKSNLQKCVRRSLVQPAVDTAWTIMCISPVELIQRLAIIWIEDACVTTDFPVLVWWLAALSKGVQLSHETAIAVLGIAAQIAGMTEHDVHGNRKSRMPLSTICLKIESSQHKSLLYALQFRRGFQSLGCDKPMIDQCTEDWMSRMVSNHDALSALVPMIQSHDPPQILSRSSWCLAAIDQHCSGLCADIARKIGRDEHEVRAVIWKCSSRITNKEAHKFGRDVPAMPDREERSLWSRIDGLAIEYADMWLDKRINA